MPMDILGDLLSGAQTLSGIKQQQQEKQMQGFNLLTQAGKDPALFRGISSPQGRQMFRRMFGFEVPPDFDLSPEVKMQRELDRAKMENTLAAWKGEDKLTEISRKGGVPQPGTTGTDIPNISPYSGFPIPNASPALNNAMTRSDTGLTLPNFARPGAGPANQLNLDMMPRPAAPPPGAVPMGIPTPNMQPAPMAPAGAPEASAADILAYLRRQKLMDMPLTGPEQELYITSKAPSLARKMQGREEPVYVSGKAAEYLGVPEGTRVPASQGYGAGAAIYKESSRGDIAGMNDKRIRDIAKMTDARAKQIAFENEAAAYERLSQAAADESQVAFYQREAQKFRTKAAEIQNQPAPPYPVMPAPGPLGTGRGPMPPAGYEFPPVAPARSLTPAWKAQEEARGKTKALPTYSDLHPEADGKVGGRTTIQGRYEANRAQLTPNELLIVDRIYDEGSRHSTVATAASMRKQKRPKSEIVNYLMDSAKRSERRHAGSSSASPESEIDKIYRR